jgi:putative nucleotidyltransferase with HDIG domain
MPLLKIGKNYGEEVAAHCRRVAALVRRVGSAMRLDDATRSDLSVAAVLHECLGVETADTEILEACNALDEAVEFAAFERTSIAGAIADFQRDTAPAFRRAVREALQQGTAQVPVSHYGPLPVMPKAASQLMRTSNETASPAQLRQIAGSDPVLCGRLLHVANSARFGGREPVTGVAEAAARLGVPMARKVLLAACFAPLFASKPLQEIWKHSQMVADAAAEAARRISLDPGLAYTAGLLHDIGRLVFAAGPTNCQVKLQQWIDDGFPLVYAETLTYRKDHARAGADLLHSWNLPPAIVEAVEYHHCPEKNDSALASLLFLAEEWSRREENAASECLNATMRRSFAEERSGLNLDAFTRPEGYAEYFALAG